MNIIHRYTGNIVIHVSRIAISGFLCTNLATFQVCSIRLNCKTEHAEEKRKSSSVGENSV